MDIKKQIEELIKTVLTSEIHGCITGSCLLDEPFDLWREVPDVDVFAYNNEAFTFAMAWLENNIPDIKVRTMADKLKRAEFVKGRFMNYKRMVNTIKYDVNGLTLNLSVRKDQQSLPDIITNFDLTCIMKGIDIRTGTELNLAGPKDCVTINPFRELDMLYWSAMTWIRQWDRVVKYWERGFDTRPAAWQYRDYIKSVVALGNPFETAKSEESFANAETTLMTVLGKIEEWLEANDPSYQQLKDAPVENPLWTK